MAALASVISCWSTRVSSEFSRLLSLQVTFTSVKVSPESCLSGGSGLSAVFILLTILGAMCIADLDATEVFLSADTFLSADFLRSSGACIASLPNSGSGLASSIDKRFDISLDCLEDESPEGCGDFELLLHLLGILSGVLFLNGLLGTSEDSVTEYVVFNLMLT